MAKSYTELKEERAALHNKMEVLLDTRGDDFQNEDMQRDFRAMKLEIEGIDAELNEMRRSMVGGDTVRGDGSLSEDGQRSVFIDAIRGEQRALTTLTDGAGGHTVPEIVSADIWGMVRDRSQVLNAGAYQLNLTSGPGGTFKIPTFEGAPVPAWRGENTVIAESDATFGARVVDPKSLAVFFKVTRELLQDTSTSDLMKFVTAQAAQEFALAIDTAALSGDGTGDQPLGLFNTAGVPTTDLVSAPMSNDVLDNAVLAVKGRNYSPSAAIVSEQSNKDLMTATAAGDGHYLGRSPYSASLPVLSTNGLTTTQVVGQFDQMIVATRNSIETIILDKAYLQSNNAIGVIMIGRWDIEVMRPDAFQLLTNVG